MELNSEHIKAIIHNIPRLSSSQRLDAENRAKDIIYRKIGNRPEMKDFSREVIYEMPSNFRTLTTRLMFGSLGAAFFMSALRLLTLGMEHAKKENYELLPAFLVGVAVIIIAEFSQLVFLLAFANSEKSRVTRFMLLAGAFISTLIALAGNGQSAIDHDNLNSMFDYLVTYGPPLIVIGVGWVLKDTYVSSAKRNQEIKVKYDEAMNRYQELVQSPKEHPDYSAIYAEIIRDEIASMANRKVGEHTNGDNIYFRDIIPLMNDDDWSWLVSRELDSGNWFRKVDTRRSNFTEAETDSANPIESEANLEQEQVIQETSNQQPDSINQSYTS